MATRGERCSGCGRQLWIPVGAQVIRCGVCQAVTRVRPFDRWGQARPPGWGFMNPNMPGPVKYRPNGPPIYNNNGFNPAQRAQYAEPRPPRPALPSPPVYGRKRALLCGVNYHQKSYSLKGSVNDVKCMKYLLVERLGFPVDCILMLTDEEKNPLRIPTKQNMRTAMRWLVQGCQPGDSLVFHFSGHGSRQRDYNNDEVDGFDETLCPLDYETEGPIIDDEINETIVRPLTYGVKLHAIVDSCRSGTILDLPFVCRMNGEGYYRWEDQRCPAAYKGTSGGLALSISACDDHENSSDSSGFIDKLSTGALTISFIQALENEPGITYGCLLKSMRHSICQAKAGIRIDGAIANLCNNTVFRCNVSQLPQLSSSETFDIYSKQVNM